MKKVGIIGGGNMGAAIINRIYKKYRILICEKDKKKADTLKKKFKALAFDLPLLVEKSDIIILAVKPQDMEAVLAEMSEYISDQLVISIAAGITSTFIEKKLGDKVRVVRTMPNMPAQIGEGMTAIAQGRFAKRTDINTAAKIFDCVGATVVVPEDLIDAITAVSGSGPAYVFLFAECFMKAAEQLGLSAELSRELIKHTLSGSVHQMYGQKDSPAVLRAKVTSKGGTTQAAMDVFFKNKIDRTFIDALSAAKKRAKELAK